MADLPKREVAVKICGLTRREDALAADALGADYVGVVLSAGFGRSVPAAVAGSLVRGLAASPVAVLVDETPAEAVRLAGALGARVLQLHGDESPDYVRRLREAGDWTLWKGVRARGPEDLARALELHGELVDGVLVEGFRDGVLGGGGARLALEEFTQARAGIPPALTVVLAGGLTPDTVADAVARFAPDVVDVSSGVERVRGRKEADLLRRFIEEATGAGRPRGPGTTGSSQGETW